MNTQSTTIKINESKHQFSTSAGDLLTNENETQEVTFVISLIDQEGREFYLDSNNNLVSLSTDPLPEPLSVTTDQLIPKLTAVRRQVVGQCTIYGLPLPEFNNRRGTTS